MGAPRLTEFARSFGFGNGDFSGDPGKNNGVDRACWIASSLRVSPYEQAVFLSKLVTRRLPVSARAMLAAENLVEVLPAAGGWQVHGKTGTAYPRNENGVADERHGYGWYVGWASRGSRTLVFARLDQDERAEVVPTGLRTRTALVAAWPVLAEAASRLNGADVR